MKTFLILSTLLLFGLTGCSSDYSSYEESDSSTSNSDLEWQYRQKDLINSYWESEALQESMTLGEYLDSVR